MDILRPVTSNQEVKSKRKIRVLIGKLGLDGHDRGAKIIATALSEAGMEVIYTGILQTPEKVVNAALQEDVDVIGLSSLAGAHETLIPRVIDLLSEKGVSDIMVLAGGIIPAEDATRLKEYGVAEVFGPGTNTRDVIAFIREAVKTKKSP